MKPGCELDALVAKKIFDQLVVTEFMVMHALMGRFVVHINDLPHYSTDIAAAWELVEKMQEKGFEHNMYSYKNGHRSAFWKDPTEDVGQRGEAGTAPHAICLAALKACGVEVE